MTTVLCIQCRKPFERTRKDRVFCCQKCNSAHRYASPEGLKYHREYYKKNKIAIAYRQYLKEAK